MHINLPICNGQEERRNCNNQLYGLCLLGDSPKGSKGCSLQGAKYNCTLLKIDRCENKIGIEIRLNKETPEPEITEPVIKLNEADICTQKACPFRKNKIKKGE